MTNRERVLLVTVALAVACTAETQEGGGTDASAPTAAICEALTNSEACHAAGCSAFVSYREPTIDPNGTCSVGLPGERCILTTKPWSAAAPGMPSTWYRWGDDGKGEVMKLGGLVCDNEIVGWKACTGADGEPQACACGAPYYGC